MREYRVTLPELGLLAATRGMIGFGAGLLISKQLGSRRRKRVGWTLLVAGVLSTIPIAALLLRGRVEAPRCVEARRRAEDPAP